MLSIVIPTLNETKSGYLERMLNQYQKVKNLEVLCIDGGSLDQTQELITRSNATLIQTTLASRAARLNKGIELAQNDLVLLHHPRSLLPNEAIYYLINDQPSGWGAFTHAFEDSHPLLSFTSWYSNFVRGDLKHIFYLDHCIFAQKNLLTKVGMLPEIDIFEDTELCLRLRSDASPMRLPFKSTTSSIRFQANGYWRQALLNQVLKIRYALKGDHRKMNRDYEKDISLNTEYKTHE